MLVAERVRARVFGEVAQRYHRVRPGYPARLVQDVIAFTGCTSPAVLEIGAGTGQATTSFATVASTLTAVEPDPAMVAILKQTTQTATNVHVVSASFEDARLEQTFDLLISAEAWHWIDPQLRWRLAVQHLRPGGTIALFWHDDRLTDPRQRAALAQALGRTRPGGDETPLDVPVVDIWPGPDMASDPTLVDVATRCYPWTRRLTVSDYVDYLSTQSWCRILPAEEHQATLADAVRALGGPTGTVELAVHTRLYFAHTAGATPP